MERNYEPSAEQTEAEQAWRDHIGVQDAAAPADWVAGYVAGKRVRDIRGTELTVADGSKIELAGVLKITQRIGGYGVLHIDGVRFPYATIDGYHISSGRTKTPGVTLTIAAQRVEAEIGEVLE